MCGICGQVNFNDSPVDPRRIERMCECLVHRGPDTRRVVTADHVGLGQQRLAIIDLSSRAAAPLANEDRTLWLVCNGEIYNFRSLRAELEDRGHRFATHTDIEVILHLYEEEGPDCVRRLHGMFAFALWDEPRRRLLAARDHLGQKPFCYTRTADTFLFASEIKALTVDPQVSVEPDFAAIDYYLTWQYVPSPRTAFRGIHKLPPGHRLVCTADGRLDVGRYWQPPVEIHGLDRSNSSPATAGVDRRDLHDRLLAAIRESVRCHLVSDVPLGAFLSGGIDSSVVVALMTQVADGPVKTFSIGFEHDAYNELPYARRVADRYGTDHHEFVVRPDATQVLPILVRRYNEPFADSSALPTYYVAQMTRRHVTVALSGDGGDELFAGYDRYHAVDRWSMCDVLPGSVRRGLDGVVRALLRSFGAGIRRDRLSRALRMFGADLPRRYHLAMSIFKPEERRAGYTRRFHDLVGRCGRLEGDAMADRCDLALPPANGEDALHWMMRHDQTYYLPDCLMVKTDIASMTHSLEVRCPFLYPPLVEFAASLPSGFKRRGRIGKRLLKAAAADLLDAELLQRPKTGFAIPLADWFCHDLRDMLYGTLLDDRFARRGLFDVGWVRRIVEQHVDGRRDWSNRLWALMFLELWFREFID